MYNSILIFIAALFLFNASLPGGQPLFSGWLFPFFMLCTAGTFYLGAKFAFAYLSARKVPFQKIELLLSITALPVFETILICCQPGYYLARLPFAKSITVLQTTGGIAIFLALLILISLAENNYSSVQGSVKEVITSNLQANLPVILPWLIITLLYDIINLQPLLFLRSFADSPYGFIGLAVIAMLILPKIICRIWGCYTMPEGVQRQDLTDFCKQLHFSAEFYLWPLHKGRAITAAVVGLIPGFRYILLTPALLNTMNKDEIKAIIAHETGHVKRYHLLLSIFLIAGFSVSIDTILEPVAGYLSSLSSLKNLLAGLGFSPSASSALLSSIPALIAMLLFFRFIFGYFIRNFEREADLYSYSAMGSAAPLISAFEKLANHSGEREKKNWHHFGLGERIDCLRKVEQAPHNFYSHRKKLHISLAVYFLLVAILTTLPSEKKAPSFFQQHPFTQLTQADRAMVQKRSIYFLSDQQEAAWYRQLGDILIRKKNEQEGIASYEKSLQLDPYNPITLNNLAWLLIASEDLALRNPERALDLALEATQWQQNGFFYDTLAAVYWANDMPEEALKAEEKAMTLDPGRKQYYQWQSWKFSTQNYKDGFHLSPKENNTPEPEELPSSNETSF